MKSIVLKYYSRKNLGDDLFVKIFTEYFNDSIIYLIANPCYIPKGLRENVKIHPFSIINTIIGKMMSYIGWDNRIALIIQRFLDYCYNRIEKKVDAIVEIGGSIFMEKGGEGNAVDFGLKRKPDYRINSCLQNHGKNFIIGANLGPVYSDRYWEHIKSLFKKYNHICLRDYSSYYMVKELAHVQYAPDVIFLTKYPSNYNNEENVVVSVINICRHTLDKNIITSYYRLLAETIIYFSNKNIKVTLVSFCEREGDEAAIKILLNKIHFSNNVSTCFYDGNIEEILKLFADSSFVIASRFHSFILGILFNKPVFPIVYNCKTENYLFDLPFEGKYAKLNDLLTLKMEDILFNYENKIITDCSDHKRYASNQFWGLRKYLNEKL